MVVVEVAGCMSTGSRCLVEVTAARLGRKLELLGRVLTPRRMVCDDHSGVSVLVGGSACLYCRVGNGLDCRGKVRVSPDGSRLVEWDGVCVLRHLAHERTLHTEVGAEQDIVVLLGQPGNPAGTAHSSDCCALGEKVVEGNLETAFVVVVLGRKAVGIRRYSKSGRNHKVVVGWKSQAAAAVGASLVAVDAAAHKYNDRTAVGSLDAWHGQDKHAVVREGPCSAVRNSVDDIARSYQVLMYAVLRDERESC